MKLVLLLCFVGIVLGQWPVGQLLVVIAPVAFLSTKPVPLSVSYQIDYNSQTQVLFNEILSVLPNPNGKSNDNSWVYVQALEQPAPSNGSWTGYHGWIETAYVIPVSDQPSYTLAVTSKTANIYLRSCEAIGCLPEDVLITVSLGTYLQDLSNENGWWTVAVPAIDNRNIIVGYIAETDISPLHPTLTTPNLRNQIGETAKLLLGQYYLWGGRSGFISSLWTEKIVVTGVDCSGLVGLSYKANGVIVARDASAQYIQTINVTDPSTLQKADVFFFTTGTRIVHVMMYLGDGTLIESSVDTNNNGTRIIAVSDRFGADLADLKWGQPVGNLFLYWGDLLDGLSKRLF